MRDWIDDDDRTFIEGCDMVFVATADAKGRPQCSYKGGDTGFVCVVDEHTVAFPNYDGNGMFLSAGNALVNPHVGLLFIDFEERKRLGARRARSRRSREHRELERRLGPRLGARLMCPAGPVGQPCNERAHRAVPHDHRRDVVDGPRLRRFLAEPERRGWIEHSAHLFLVCNRLHFGERKAHADSRTTSSAGIVTFESVPVSSRWTSVRASSVPTSGPSWRIVVKGGFAYAAIAMSS